MSRPRSAPLHASLYHRCKSVPAPTYVQLKHVAHTNRNGREEVIHPTHPSQQVNPHHMLSPLEVVASLIPNKATPRLTPQLNIFCSP